MILVWIERESLEGVDVKGRRAGTALCGARDSVAQLVLAGPGALGGGVVWMCVLCVSVRADAQPRR